jgi:DUF1365 family protein
MTLPTSRPAKFLGNGKLLIGGIKHRRSTPPANEFTYQVLYVEVDLADVRDGRMGSIFFSHNRSNIYSINDRNHYRDEQGSFATAIPRLVAATAPSVAVKAITMITQPSVLGYVFNPVSFYEVHDGGSQPAMVIAEVHNRAKQQHLYVLERSGKQDESFSGRFQKNFYVSPFLKEKGEYQFSIVSQEDSLRLSLDLYQEGELVLGTTLSLRREPLTDFSLLKAMATRPFTPQKTLAAIYWQALKLKLHGAKYAGTPKSSSGEKNA